MGKMLAVDPEKCTSCRLCELVCSETHEGGFRPSRARIEVTIRADEAFYFPRVCIQCQDAPCIEACPTEALVRDARTGAVVVVEENCSRCGLCESECPYGVIHCLDEAVLKCDLCGGDPQCVQFCAPEALRFVQESEWPGEQRREYVRRLENLAKEATR